MSSSSDGGYRCEMVQVAWHKSSFTVAYIYIYIILVTFSTDFKRFIDYPQASCSWPSWHGFVIVLQCWLGALFFSLALCIGGAKWASQPCRASTAVRCRRFSVNKKPTSWTLFGTLAKIVHTQLKVSKSPLTDVIFWKWVRSHQKVESFWRVGPSEMPSDRLGSMIIPLYLHHQLNDHLPSTCERWHEIVTLEEV